MAVSKELREMANRLKKEAKSTANGFAEGLRTTQERDKHLSEQHTTTILVSQQR